MSCVQSIPPRFVDEVQSKIGGETNEYTATEPGRGGSQGSGLKGLAASKLKIACAR
jgi:hypothetical protein